MPQMKSCLTFNQISKIRLKIDVKEMFFLSIPYSLQVTKQFLSGYM